MMGIIVRLISKIRYEIESPFFDCDLEEVDFDL